MQRHPSASLTFDEIQYASSRMKAAVAPSVLTFYEISLHESLTTAQKDAVLRGDKGAMPARRARIIAADPRRRVLLDGHAPVDESGDPPLVRWHGATQAALTASEYELVSSLICTYEPFLDECRRRGIAREHVRADPWCVGWFGSDDDPTRRLAEPILYLSRGDAADSLYMQPLEGVAMRVDLWAEPPAVIAFEVVADYVLPPPHPQPLMRFPTASASRAPLAPLSLSQPEGGGYSLGVDGRLQWQRWEAVVSFNAREGAVLSCVRYDGRPVAWRLSFAEMVVPYGDPHPPHYKKAAFDAGEDGLGRNAHSLEPTRCDCAPGAAASFLDAVLVDESGAPDVLRRAVCVHEADGGLLWKHLDWRTGESVARRGRQLVVMFLTTIANYTYGFSYTLGLDASIHMEATLTGILSIGALPKAAPSRPWGQTLASDEAGGESVLYGPHHQHFFVARCDMAVDGCAHNRVVEVETAPVDALAPIDHEDAYALRHGRGNAFRKVTRTLATEGQGRRDAAPRLGRHWVVHSTRATNAVGELVGWRLEPGAGSAIAVACSPDAPFLQRAGFLRHNLWVTGYRHEERYPGGDYPNQRPSSAPSHPIPSHPSLSHARRAPAIRSAQVRCLADECTGNPDGLPAWTLRDDRIDDSDVVLAPPLHASAPRSH